MDDVTGKSIRGATITTPKTASFLRRMGAITYDAMLLFGVLFVAAIPLVLIEPDTREIPGVEWLIRAYLLTACFAYFGWCWHHGGQTLGMRAWKVRLMGRDGVTPRKRDLVVRFLAAILSWLLLGGGYLWILFNSRREALHDRLSRTIIVHEER
jgi:uncharacterized RDD family membrane protein YckC